LARCVRAPVCLPLGAQTFAIKAELPYIRRQSAVAYLFTGH
jgi:hypothetical protein